MIYEVIDTVSKKCVNKIVWDGVSPWSPPENHEAQVDTGLTLSQSIVLKKQAGTWIRE